MNEGQYRADGGYPGWPLKVRRLIDMAEQVEPSDVLPLRLPIADADTGNRHERRKQAAMKRRG